MAKLTKTERKELVEIMEGKYNRKVKKIREVVEPQVQVEVDRRIKEQKRVEKAAHKALKATLPTEDYKLVTQVSASGNGRGYWHVHQDMTDIELEKQGLGDMDDKIAELPERLFVAAVTADGIEDILKEFSNLD